MSNQNHNDNGIIKEKLKKVEELKEIGIEPYGRKYQKLNDIAEINQYARRNKILKAGNEIDLNKSIKLLLQYFKNIDNIIYD